MNVINWSAHLAGLLLSGVTENQSFSDDSEDCSCSQLSSTNFKGLLEMNTELTLGKLISVSVANNGSESKNINPKVDNCGQQSVR